MRYILLIPCLLAISFAQEIKRPTTDTDAGNNGCIGNRVASPSMALGHDGAGLATSVDLSQGGTASQTQYSARTFSNWTTPGLSYTSLTLNINSSSGGWGGAGNGQTAGGAKISYSLDGGNTLTLLRNDVSGNGWGQLTDTVSLSASQDLTKIRVYFCVYGFKQINQNLPGSDDINVWDVWTSGSGNGAAGGNGNGSGLPARAIISVN